MSSASRSLQSPTCRTRCKCSETTPLLVCTRQPRIPCSCPLHIDRRDVVALWLQRNFWCFNAGAHWVQCTAAYPTAPRILCLDSWTHDFTLRVSDAQLEPIQCRRTICEASYSLAHLPIAGLDTVRGKCKCGCDHWTDVIRILPEACLCRRKWCPRCCDESM